MAYLVVLAFFWSWVSCTRKFNGILRETSIRSAEKDAITAGSLSALIHIVSRRTNWDETELAILSSILDGTNCEVSKTGDTFETYYLFGEYTLKINQSHTTLCVVITDGTITFMENVYSSSCNAFSINLSDPDYRIRKSELHEFLRVYYDVHIRT